MRWRGGGNGALESPRRSRRPGSAARRGWRRPQLGRHPRRGEVAGNGRRRRTAPPTIPRKGQTAGGGPHSGPPPAVCPRTQRFGARPLGRAPKRCGRWDGVRMRGLRAAHPHPVNSQCFSFFTSSTISGTALNRSATRPKSATLKIGASSSLLIATIVFESFIPARC